MKPGRQSLVIIKAVDPASVVCAESILVNALTTLGVPLHAQPGMGYAEFREQLPDGRIRRTFRWTLLPRSLDGKYATTDLMKWWNDPEWLAKNPAHELTILRTGLINMLKLAARIRGTPHLEVLRKGKRMAIIPSQIAPEKRDTAIARLHAA